MNWYQHDRLVTAPTFEPVTVDTLKEHLRIVTTDEDTILAQYLAAARVHVGNATGRSLCTETRETTLGAFPEVSSLLVFGASPVASVTSVKYLDEDLAEQTWSSVEYTTDLTSERAAIIMKDAYSWPTTGEASNAVRIRYVSGQALADVPPTLKQAVLFLAAHWYTNREPVTSAGSVSEIPMALDALITSHRIIT